MSFQEQLNSLREKIKGKIKPESTEEELGELNGILGELDEMEKSHNDLVTENAKFKDTIVKMVTTQGDDKPPQDDPSGSKPRTLGKFIEDFEKEHKED